MGRRKLRHDRHTVTLSTDHMVFSPKYRGKILIGEMALALDGIIRKICKDIGIEIVDMAVFLWYNIKKEVNDPKREDDVYNPASTPNGVHINFHRLIQNHYKEQYRRCITL